MKILIVGGGIAGLGLANFLQRYPQWDITIAERSPEWKTIGYAIGLHGNGEQALAELGLYEAFQKFSYAGEDNTVFTTDGRLLHRLLYSLLRYRDKPVSSFYRQDLHGLLSGNLTIKDIRFNCHITDIARTEDGENRQIVTFSNGAESTTEVFDLVVGADGMRSWIREHAVEPGRLGFYGWKIWLNWLPDGMVPPNELTGLAGPRGSMEIVNPSKALWFIPTREKCTVGFIFVDDSRNKHGNITSPQQRSTVLREKFADMPQALEIIEKFTATDYIFEDDLTFVRLGKWYKDTVVLIGDAAHGISPIPGFGSSLALEDGYVLGTILGNVHEAKNIPAGLELFTKKRTPKIKRVKRTVFFFERLLITNTRTGTYVRNAILRITPDNLLAKMVHSLLADPF